MHEENFLSSWLGEGRREKEVRRVEMRNENDEERCDKRRREQENETESVRRRCVSSHVGDLESCGGGPFGEA